MKKKRLLARLLRVFPLLQRRDKKPGRQALPTRPPSPLEPPPEEPEEEEEPDSGFYEEKKTRRTGA